MRPNQPPNLPVNNPPTNPQTNEATYYNRYASTVGNNVDNNPYNKYNRFNNQSQAINYPNNSIQSQINYPYGNMYPPYGIYNHQYLHNNQVNPNNPINTNIPNSVNNTNQMNANVQENPYQQYNQYIPNPNTRNNNYYSNNRYTQANMNNKVQYNKPNNQYNRDMFNLNINANTNINTNTNTHTTVSQNNYNNNIQQSYYNRNNNQTNQYRNPNHNYSNETNKYQNTKNTERYDNQIAKADKKNSNLHKNNDRKAQTPRYKPEDKNQPFNDEQQAYQQSDYYQSEQQDEQQLYHKTKQIAKKRDPILDSPSQIKKWIQARKRNYPKSNSNKQEENNKLSGQMSILESKIRKKIMIISGDSRGLIKKLKNMHILKRIVGDIGKNTNKVINKKRNNNFKEKQKLRMNKINQEKAQQQKNKRQAEIIQKKQKQRQNVSEISSENSDQPEQIPICKIPPIQLPIPIEKQIKPLISELPKANTQNMNQNEGSRAKSTGFTPQQMIKHLKQKQDEDKQFFSKLLNYNTNSLNYKYSVGTLETNFVLQDIFEESSYLLQIIRHIIKNGFFDKK